MSKTVSVETHLFHRFSSPIRGISLPENFTYPFYYKPHPLCKIAARELQEVIKSAHWECEFRLGDDASQLGKGKMFGVLLVQNNSGEIGYLAAFSGNLENAPQGFVPFVYSLPKGENFYSQGMQIIKDLGAQIENAESSPALRKAKKNLQMVQATANSELKELRSQMRLAKAKRKERRIDGKKLLLPAEFKTLEKSLAFESQKWKYRFKALKKDWEEKLDLLETDFSVCIKNIQRLILQRAEFSAHLQKALFDKYVFLNKKGEAKSLTNIFGDTDQPPSGAGDCALPKMLQYAFAHNLKPLAMAEFWWGKSPSTVIRHHKNYYPACKSKCRPILAFMLSGMKLDANPLLRDYGIGKNFETVYEDDFILVVNKPFGLLSVPGKKIVDSVSTRLRNIYPNASGPLLVHRLDQDTSGLLLIAKSERVHKALQLQFLKRTIKKRYVALLDGVCHKSRGTVNLPLRVDLGNRPSQMVCFEHGKNSETKYEVEGIQKGKTRIHLFPITGRTHQLRVHMAHPLGLNLPIIGDILYGSDSDRMFLHAEYLEFTHPISKIKLTIEAKAEF